jgi:hypothetical protein
MTTKNKVFVNLTTHSDKRITIVISASNVNVPEPRLDEKGGSTLLLDDNTEINVKESPEEVQEILHSAIMKHIAKNNIL